MSKSDAQFLDELEIRRLIENWVVWRDSGDFERLAGLWHPQGRMVTVWSQSSASEFIASIRTGFENGAKALHVLGGSSIDVSGTRAISQTRMEIRMRGRVHDVEVDVSCHGRFYDFLEKVDGRWLLYLRQPIYELDRMDPVEPGARIDLDAEVLNSIPEGYRHTAYILTQMGLEVTPDLPGTRGPVVEALYARGRLWLAGEPAQ